MYAAGSDTAWDVSDLKRTDWDLAADFIDRSGAGSVLDVGCYDGHFFDFVDVDVRRFGVEANREACNRARANGVEIVAHDIQALDGIEDKFDVVVAFDVIEHVHDPAALLRQLLGATRAGGYVVFATGNFASPTQRVMGSKYLYSWYQEHIAFVSPEWTRAQAARFGAEVQELRRFSHHEAGMRGFMTGMAKNLVYRIARPLVDRSPTRRAMPVVPGPPVWTSANDHFLAILRKE